MKIKAIGFDIGGTLVNYDKPLNWSASYGDALEFMCNKTKIECSEERKEAAKKVLTKYNTRINPREEEVTSDVIFSEIFEIWNEDMNRLLEAKKNFYKFFQRDVTLYEDAIALLKYCRQNNIKTSVYTDVAYGMDDEYSLMDINEIIDYIDLKLTSRNVGYRKPNKKGFEIMLKEFNCKPEEMLFVGDEKKDIIGANNVGIRSVLINREDKLKEFNQEYTVNDLSKIIDIISNMSLS